jgi:hypothetical protein
MSPETWSNLLYTYGPNAVLILLVFVIERQVRSAWRKANTSNKREQTLFLTLYGLTWLMIFGIAICSIYFWWLVNLSRRPQITGTIENLPNVEILGTTFADLYLHKNSKGGGYSDYDLLLINRDQKQWPEGTKVRFTIQAPRPHSSDDLYEYELPIRSDFYKTGVCLKRRQNKLILDHDNRETELLGGLLPSNVVPGAAAPNDVTPHSTLIKPTWDLLPTAYAQAEQYAQAAQPAFSSDEFTAGLESPDAIVRRKTRYVLSLQDQSVAIPWIESVLNDKASSYRLRLGVLVALNNMPNVHAESLLPATITAIQNTLNDPDDALRNEALGLAKKYKLIPVSVYEHFDFTGKSQAYGPGKYRADRAQLGSLPNDSASSVRVAKGFAVRLCENEGDGRGGGVCVTKGPGNYSLPWGPESVADKVSFIYVFTLANSTSASSHRSSLR